MSKARDIGNIFSASTDMATDTEVAASYATKANFPADAWTAYTPTITADGGGFSLGNGTISGRYKQLGKTVYFHVKFIYGSTTNPGSGHWNFSLPVTAQNANFTFPAAILDSGVAWYGGIGNGNYTGSTTTFAVNVTSPNAAVATWVTVGNGGPFTGEMQIILLFQEVMRQHNG